MTEIESVDRPVPLEDGGTWRMLLMQLRRDRGGNPESFLFAYALTRVSGSGEYQDGVPTRHQSRKTESFLRGWRGAMNHWASHNVDALKKSLWRQRDERHRSIRLRPVSGCVLVTPGPPARPELSSLVSWTLERSPDPHRPLLFVP